MVEMKLTHIMSKMTSLSFREFNDMLGNEVQREFFRRYLSAQGAEAALQFILAVNDVKISKDAKMKNNKIAQIVRKYFPDQNTGSIDAHSRTLFSFVF